MNGEWFWRDKGQVRGPITYAALVSLVQAKQLTGNMEVRQGSAGPWMYAGQVKGLFQAAAPMPVVAQPVPAEAMPLDEIIMDDEPAPSGSGGVNLGVSFIIADSFLTGIVATLAGVASFIGSLIVAWYFLLGVLLLVVAGCCFLLSYGLMTHQKWARLLLLVTYGLHLAVGIIMMIILFIQLKKLQKLELKEIGSMGMTLGIIFSMLVAVAVIALSTVGPLHRMLGRR